MKVLIAITLLTIALAQAPPVWPVRFQQEFVESYSTTSFRDIGKLWYDSERNMSRLDRTNGKYDPMCNSIVNGSTLCIQLVREGRRYMVFPLLRECCYCCDSAHGCGILKRDWLSRSVYKGKEDLSGEYFNKWSDAEEGSDYWAAINTKQVPRRLAEGNGAMVKDFIMNTYSE